MSSLHLSLMMNLATHGHRGLHECTNLSGIIWTGVYYKGMILFSSLNMLLWSQNLFKVSLLLEDNNLNKQVMSKIKTSLFSLAFELSAQAKLM